MTNLLLEHLSDALADAGETATVPDLLAAVLARRTGARLLGVRLSELVSPLGPDQLALFEQRAAEAVESERDRTLAHAVDRIQAKLGRRGIVPGSLLEDEKRKR